MTAAEQEAIKEYIDAIVELRVVERESALEIYVDQAVAKMATELRDHIKALAHELTEQINGIPSPQVPTAEIERAVSVAVAALPVTENGKDADPAVIEKMVADAVASIPTPKDGEPGKDGKDGAQGKDGKDVDPLVIKEMVVQAVAGLPPAKDGRDGRDAKDGKDGRDGKDGITVDQLKSGLEEMLSKNLPDAVSLAVTTALEDIPLLTWAGVWEAGKSYVPGNVLTFGGSMWHCNKPTTDKPETSDAWSLCVKKGRDFRPPDRK